jgi:hypothetical protein
MPISRWEQPGTAGASPLDILGWFAGPQVPDPITFVISPDYLARENIYPRQTTMLKLIFLRDDLFTDYDREVIDEWTGEFLATNPNAGLDNKFEAQTQGCQPDIYERITYLKERGYRWFSEVILAIGRRGGKGYISALAMAYVLWNYLATGNPQEAYGIDRDKPLACMIFAAKKELARMNLWGDLYAVITGAPCFTPFISEPLAESLTVYAPYDMVRIRQLAARGIRSAKDMASFHILPRESTMTAPRGVAGFIIGFDEAAHVKNAGTTRSFGDVYNAARPALDQFGKDGFAVLPSSTWEMIGRFYELWSLSLERETAKHGDLAPSYPDKFMLQLPSWGPYKDWERAPELPLFPPDFQGDLGEYRTVSLPRLAPLKGAIQVYDEAMMREERSNPDTFAVERKSHWATALDAYLNTARVNAMFAPWEGREPQNGRPDLQMQERGLLIIDYRAHGDPSTVNNRFGFAMAHIEYEAPGALDERILVTEGARDPVIRGSAPMAHAVFDLIHFWDPADFPGHIIDYDVIINWIYDRVVLPFQPGELTFDQFNSVATVQFLQKKVRGAPVQKNIQVYERPATQQLNWATWETFKAALNMGLVHAPPHPEAADELKFLQKPEGQMKVVCPDSGPVQTKDIADCYDHLVEVLTEHGWKLFKDVLDGERVATRNERGELEYQHFTDRIERWHTGPMYQFEGKRLNFNVTPGHRMLVSPWASRDWRFIRAEDLSPGQRYAIPKTTVVVGREPGIVDIDGDRIETSAPGVRGRGGWSPEEDAWLTANYPSMAMDELLRGLPGRTRGSAYQRAVKVLGLKRGQIGDRHADRPKPLSPVSRELFAQFLGFWLAEGRKYHSGTHRGYGVKISQTKPEGIAWFHNLLLQLGWPYSEHIGPREVTWEIKSYGLREYLRALCTGGHELHIPDEVFTTWTVEEMKGLLHGLAMGDGSFSAELQRHTCYYSSSRRLIDDVQRLMLHIGMSGQIRQTGSAGDLTNFEGYRAKHDRWAIGFDTKGSGIAGVQGSQIEQVDYDGMVYCLTVPNGTLMVRRKGVAMWSGNCIAIVTASLLGEQMKAFLANDLASLRPRGALPGGADPLRRFDPEQYNPFAGQLGQGLSRGMRPQGATVRGALQRPAAVPRSNRAGGYGAGRRHRS